MDYVFSQHDLSFLDDVIPEKDKKKKEDEKKKKKKRGSIDSDAEDVRLLTFSPPSLPDSPFPSLFTSLRPPQSCPQLLFFAAACAV